ncbi:MAG TPA: hypothetical protein VJ780_02645 [Flavobacterium sp.]|nr:hypothetical protein [Flavobacterium sp.]
MEAVFSITLFTVAESFRVLFPQRASTSETLAPITEPMEIIYNFFTFCDNKIIRKIGYAIHECDGEDDIKIEYLKAKVNDDFLNLKFISIPSSFKIINSKNEETIGINLETYNTLVHNQTVGVFFEYVFKKYNASKTPLFVNTMVVDGEIKIEGTGKVEPIPKAPFTYSITEKIANDYFDDYMDDKGFNLDKLMEDDFFKAVRKLFQEEYYVSCLKLLMSVIDTVGFLEYDDVPGNFKNWINTYCDLSKMNVTSEELWELRNSLLHMTNARSRKVKQNITTQLSFYVSNEDIEERISDGHSKYFNLKTLIHTVADGFEKWGESFNEQNDKFKEFIDRYDLIISDTRCGKVYYNT